MSEFYVEVVRLGKIEKLPNSDTLSITNVFGGYPCIIKTGTFSEGDLATYISVDAMVPVEKDEFKFLLDKAKDGYARIRAIKLRGTFSMGLLVKAPLGSIEGDKVQEILGIKKYLPPAEREPNSQSATGNKKKTRTGIFWKVLSRIQRFFGFLPPPAPTYPYYDIEGVRKYTHIFQDGEEVVLTEKIHGMQASYVYTNKRLYAKSRNLFRNSNDTWNLIAKRYDLANKLKQYPGFVLYGEIYGNVQDLKYGVSPLIENVAFMAFDVLDLKSNTFLSYDDFILFCKKINVPTVPELYRGPWNGELISYAEGKSTVKHADHVREGFVAKPVIERNHPHFGRVILKLHGQGFLLRK